MHLKRAALSLASAAALIAAAVPAHAANLVSQLPGASADGAVVVTDSPHVSVDVEKLGAEHTAKVNVKNNYDHAFECYAPGASTDPAKPEKLPNVVTEARIVTDSMNYYRAQPFLPKNGQNVPLLGVIPTDVFLQYVPQGSAGNLLGSDTAARAELSRQWDRARIAGHTGEIAPFTLQPGASETLEVKLGAPGHGERSDFDAAALLYCTDVQDQQAYVFAGYEPGVNPMWSGLSSHLPAQPATGSSNRN
ncbi:hypothetical protein [Corynebacterium gerontici]|uniref:Secreted protein n=1 Tax=Corynebacterium gerontici TaxID=2079234 RepID=A0A3G6IZA7_9CORY|nr:hypothetical protein [Corynebacterium gerontici]AZA10986.1 hypothetical protein CGERO_03330 [Corynebacterium gerontici]